MPLSRSRHACLFVPSLATGGAERVAVNIANHLASEGWNIDLLAAKAAETSYEVSSNVRIITLGKSGVFKSLPGFVKYLIFNKPSALVSFMDHANAVAILAVLISNYKGKLILTVHSDPLTWLYKIKNPANTIIRMIYRLLNITKPKIVAVSCGVAHSFIIATKVKPTLVKTIYNPIDLEEVRRLSHEPLDISLEKEVKYVIFVGRLTEAKDLATLLNAFRKLRSERPSKLIIVGDGEERESLEKMIREMQIGQDIIMTGFELNPYRYIARSDVLVLSSQFEGLSNVLIEALAVGTPIVSTDCLSGPREIVEHAGVGRLVPVGDADALARAILETFDDTSRPIPNLSAFEMSSIMDQYKALLTAPRGNR